jgi:hypothetical protein
MERKRKSRKAKKQRRNSNKLIMRINLRKDTRVDIRKRRGKKNRKVRVTKHRLLNTPPTSYPTSITIQSRNPYRKFKNLKSKSEQSSTPTKDPKSEKSSTPTNHPQIAGKTAT